VNVRNSVSVRSYPLSVLLHLISVIIYGYTILWGLVHENAPTSKPIGKIGGKLKYLTYWNLWIQFITFSLCLLNDLIVSPNDRNYALITRIRDYSFNCLCQPIGILVVTTFWILYSIDRELIFPVAIEKYIPFWMNHSTHTIVLPIICMETYLVSHKRSSLATGISILLSFLLVYVLWILYIGVALDYWVYPVLNQLNWQLRAVFIIGCGVSAIAFYFVGQLTHNICWPHSLMAKPVTNKKLK